MIRNIFGWTVIGCAITVGLACFTDLFGEVGFYFAIVGAVIGFILGSVTFIMDMVNKPEKD